MNDYEYKNDNTEDTGFSTDGSPKKPKKHTGAKIIAYLMAIALISGVSIKAYTMLEDRNANNDDTRSVAVLDDDDEEEAPAKEAKIEAETVSLIKTEKPDSKALSTEEVVEKMLPTVVGIESTFEITRQNSVFDDSIFGFNFGGFGGFGNDYSSPQTSEATATGTGVIVSKDGYIVTNAHVIYDTEYQGGEAKRIAVLLNEGGKLDAEVVGYDVNCDLAVLKIEPEQDLAFAEFGDSDTLKLGESVIAIGNPLGFDLKNTVTGGMISGLNRNTTINDQPMNLIQTDAAINSGNSGGPLINKYGQVIGINSAKMSSSYSGEASIEGIGFAIPSNQVSKIVEELITNGFVAKPRLGISTKDVSSSDADIYGVPEGILIREVTEDSAAEKAGLKVRDIITAVDGKRVKTFDELSAMLNTHTAGDKMEITFTRGDEEKTVTAVLDAAEDKNKSNKNDSDDEESEEETTKKGRSDAKAKDKDSEE